MMAEILHVSQRHVWALIANGQLPVSKIGGATRVWLDDLKKFATDHTIRRSARHRHIHTPHTSTHEKEHGKNASRNIPR